VATHWIRFFSIKKTRCSISIFFSTIKIFNRSLWCLGVTVVISFLTMKFFKSKCCRSWFGFRHSCLWDYVIQGQLLVFMEKIFCYEVTKMEKMILVVWMILSMIMLMLELAITGLLVKSGCPDQCWEICISYLFGTKKKSYKDEWFTIECNQTPALRQLLYISSIKLEVVNIYSWKR